MMELIIVVIIVSILAMISIPLYRKALIQTKNRDAKSMLSLIADAEEMKRLELGGCYVSCTSNSNCNALLDLSLPSGAVGEWNYTVKTYHAAKDEFCAQATNTKDGRTFKFYPFSATPDSEPVSGTCS